MTRFLPVVCGLFVACGDPSSGLPAAGGGKADDLAGGLGASWDHDILSTALRVNLGQRSGTATIRIAPTNATGISFDVKGLEVLAVRGAEGELPHRVELGRLDVAAPTDGELSVAFRFQERAELEGQTNTGVTFTWPYFCGNLFPCKSDPADGLRFTIELEGVPETETAVFPKVIPADAPSYMAAWAVGEYSYRKLGVTRAGTEVGVYWLPGEEADALRGTAALAAHFDWLEQTIGPYLYGDRVASVSARWANAYGGMEHHPFWHVDAGSMDDAYIHAHEAAHGWFGDGIRLRCWEDFVLSEGPVSYLAARAMAAVGGPTVEKQIWSRFKSRLESAVASTDVIAWPDSCGKLDILKDDIYTSIPYMKGAFFLRAIELLIGRDAIDRALSRFYIANAGKAAGMADLIATLTEEAVANGQPATAVTALAQRWLREKGLPELPPMP
jgi:hypothetical protein